MAAAPRLARLSGMSLASSCAIHVLGAAAGIMTARFLGPEGKGLLVIIVLWPGLLAALGGGLGLEDAVVYFTAREVQRRGAVLATGALLGCLQSAVLTGFGWLVLPWLLQGQGPAVIADARLYLIWILLSHLTLTAMAALQGSLRFTSLNLLRTVTVTCTAAGLAALYVAGAVSVRAVVLVYLIASSISLAGAWSVAARRQPGLRPDFSLIKPLVSYAAKAQLGHVAAVANERIDLVVLSLLLVSSQLGLYAAALSVGAAVRVFGSSFALVALPALARPGDGARDRAHDLARLARAAIFSSLAAAAAGVLIVPAAFPLLFGPAFSAGIPVAQVLVLATVLLNATRVLSAGLKGMGLPASASIGEVLGAAATITGMLALIPQFGLLGAAGASVLSYLVSLAYLSWIANRRLAVCPEKLFVPTRADVAWLQAALRGLIARPAPMSA